jgi:hypothetical protein
MNTSLLIVRISRRAIAAAMLSRDHLSLLDGRHLTSKSDRAIVTATHFVSRCFDLSKPSHLVIDGPSLVEGSTVCRVIKEIEALAAGRKIPTLNLERSEFLLDYGLDASRYRQELRELLPKYFPEIRQLRDGVRSYAADAAAVALWADTHFTLNPPST